MVGSSRLLVIDAGTTGIRALVYDERAEVLARAYTEFRQYRPGPDRIEQDPDDIWRAARRMMSAALADAGLAPADVTAVGITNQRATTVVWDSASGEPAARAIGWQDTRTAGRAAELMPTWGERVYARTGWALAPVYSALSLEWLLTNGVDVRGLADRGRLRFGTVDSWLIYKLTGGAAHVISASNASVTGSFDLFADDWYGEWLDALGIPMQIYPTVCDDSGLLGVTDPGVFGARVPIAAAVADQHSALFAQGCIEPGMVKCTHGTGTFVDMTIGASPVIDTASGLTCQIAWRIGDETVYALEGYAASTGAAVQWLRDGVGIVDSSAESETVARTVADNGGVYFVPALAGLSAPYWDAYARGMIIGIGPGTQRGHLVRATLEGIVFSIRDFIDTMSRVSGNEISQLAVDGGASANDLLLQLQADQLGVPVVRPHNTEATSLGAALLAGLAVGTWSGPQEALAVLATEARFGPAVSDRERESGYATWGRAVDRARGWLAPQPAD